MPLSFLVRLVGGDHDLDLLDEVFTTTLASTLRTVSEHSATRFPTGIKTSSSSSPTARPSSPGCAVSARHREAGGSMPVGGGRRWARGVVLARRYARTRWESGSACRRSPKPTVDDRSPGLVAWKRIPGQLRPFCLVVSGWVGLFLAVNLVVRLSGVAARWAGKDPRVHDDSWPDIRNLRVVGDRLLVGGATSLEQYRGLAERDVTLVIDMRTGGSGHLAPEPSRPRHQPRGGGREPGGRRATRPVRLGQVNPLTTSASRPVG